MAKFLWHVLLILKSLLTGPNLVIGTGKAQSANLLLFWDGAAAPTGWTIVSNSGGFLPDIPSRGCILDDSSRTIFDEEDNK
jgi:hypothetical protein